jgi:hypothetical protein
MDKILSRRIFADHYQFYIYDSTERYWETLGHWPGNTSRRGYMSSGRALGIATVADLNVHWLEVYRNHIAPDLEECERALAFNFSITSGILSILCLADEEESTINIENGDYVIYILAYNLGVDEYSDSDDVSDKELEQMTDIERYQIVLVPGRIEIEGVIKGEEYIAGDPSCNNVEG